LTAFVLITTAAMRPICQTGVLTVLGANRRHPEVRGNHHVDDDIGQQLFHHLLGWLASSLALCDDEYNEIIIPVIRNQ
jgi:hypothetical protein